MLKTISKGTTEFEEHSPIRYSRSKEKRNGFNNICKNCHQRQGRHFLSNDNRVLCPEYQILIK